MSLLKRINDKGAVIAWSPLRERPALLALGTKVSTIDSLYPLYREGREGTNCRNLLP